MLSWACTGQTSLGARHCACARSDIDVGEAVGGLGLRGTSLGIAAALAAAVASLGLTVVSAAPGHGVASQSEPLLALSPDPLDFGEVVVDESSVEAVTASNTSGGDLTVRAVDLIGDAFTHIGDDCGRTLAPHDTCTVHVSFNPTDAGEWRGQVVFDTDVHPVAGELLGVGMSGKPTTTATTEPTATSTTTEPAVTTTADGAAPTTTTPASGPTTTAPTPDTTIPDAVRLAECERRARDATVEYPTSIDMTVGEPKRFVVVASSEDGGTTSSTDVATTVEPVQLRCEVQAQLRGLDFMVDPDGFQLGSFLDQPTITWSWEVVAQKPGESTLEVEIRSVAVIDGRPIVGAGRVLYSSAINVEAQPEALWQRSKRISAEVTDHPLVRGLGSLLLLGATVAGAWHWLLRRPWPWLNASPSDHRTDLGGQGNLAQLGIVQEGDPILRRVARPFGLPNEAQDAQLVIAELTSAMERVETLHDFPHGVGISAPQIGTDRAAVLIRAPDHETITLLNPEVVEETAAEEQYEGCLSFSDMRGKVPRPLTMHVEHQTVDGRRHITVFERDVARLVAHEIDHLNGVLYPDRMRPGVELVPVARHRRGPDHG